MVSSMADIEQARQAVIERVLRGPGQASQQVRAAAFERRDVPDSIRALVDKVAMTAYAIEDTDIAAARKADVSEDEVFEVCVCAALGQASRQYDAALAALAAATKKVR
jgi:hypothetical protein